MQTSVDNAISIAKKAKGAARYHDAQNLTVAHYQTVPQLPDGTNVFELAGGEYSAKHLVNGPEIANPDDMLWIKVTQLDGKIKHWTVIDHGNKIQYDAEGFWFSNDRKPSWTQSEMAHNLPMSDGISGDIVQSVYRVNDHTEIDIRVDVKVAYPGKLAWVMLGWQDEIQFLKNKQIIGAAAVYNDAQQSTPAVLNLTPSGRIGIVCEAAGTSVQGYLHYILEPDGKDWSKWKNFPIGG